MAPSREEKGRHNFDGVNCAYRVFEMGTDLCFGGFWGHRRIFRQSWKKLGSVTFPHSYVSSCNYFAERKRSTVVHIKNKSDSPKCVV